MNRYRWIGAIEAAHARCTVLDRRGEQSSSGMNLRLLRRRSQWCDAHSAQRITADRSAAVACLPTRVRCRTALQFGVFGVGLAVGCMHRTVAALESAAISEEQCSARRADRSAEGRVEFALASCCRRPSVFCLALSQSARREQWGEKQRSEGPSEWEAAQTDERCTGARTDEQRPDAQGAARSRSRRIFCTRRKLEACLRCFYAGIRAIVEMTSCVAEPRARLCACSVSTISRLRRFRVLCGVSLFAARGEMRRCVRPRR